MGRNTLWWIVAAAVASLAAGCGAKDDEQSASQQATPASQEAIPSTPEPVLDPALDDSDMATAVVTGKTSAAVDLKYEIADRPEPGQPIEAELSFAPRLPADEMRVVVTGVDGLNVVSGSTESFKSVEAGGRYRSRLLMQADASGLYYVTVAVEMITAVQTDARVFSIPVAVGVTAASTKSEAPRDASGQAIQPMDAEETTDANE